MFTQVTLFPGSSNLEIEAGKDRLGTQSKESRKIFCKNECERLCLKFVLDFTIIIGLPELIWSSYVQGDTSVLNKSTSHSARSEVQRT